MPYRWSGNDGARTLVLWPHRSMTPGGFAGFLGVTAALALVPLLAVLGSPVLWWLLAFFGLAFAAMWFALLRSNRDADLSETLTIDGDRIELVRRDVGGQERRWSANTYWVTIHLHPGERPVPNYLTLKGDGREVELGAFLGPEERIDLERELRRELAAMR